MTKRTFIEYLSESNFQELFIREMGWNNPRGQLRFDLTIEEETYYFTVIAERNGFQVMTCQVRGIPTSSLCKKIDTRLRRQANDYICIFHLLSDLQSDSTEYKHLQCAINTQHHLWMVPVKKVEKRDIVLVEYETAERAGFLYEKVDGLTFDLGEVTTIMDVKERIQGAFVINSEKITKDFYTGFRKEHTQFAKYITGIDDEITDIKKNRNKQWYTSVMLNRLMFCYFIQKKGFLDQNTNYLRDKLDWVKREKGEDRFYGSFYQGFLISLFHDGMNTPRHERDFTQKYGRIPYLNGGMFDIHELENHYPNIDIKDEAFESLFSFFDQWHWHLDDRLTATGKDINPDVLGYIFEQYINDRAQMGAYYTKEDITEYIGRNTIVPYLMDATTIKLTNSKTQKLIWQFLQNSGDRYIFDAVKKGHDKPIPDHIAIGIDTSQPNLLERRSRWNERTPEEWALPTEIWRETVERLQRYQSIRSKIENGEIHEINDFITYNLDIRQFVQDYLAQTDDHLFVLHFYHALQHITILDPTCGSGAFLFAALNILEPLYETCIDRMQTWASVNPNLFKDKLQELNVKYRSNIRYFIYKSIILRNLYGVDIMVEATEIAKLRLFLKMVAVVDVNPRDPNLGLEPLPDIDFNIRCGNALVGYATEKELQDGLLYTDLFARQEFEQKVNDEMIKVSMAYDVFKQVQLKQETNLDTFKSAKKELKQRLKELNKLLNQNLHAATNAEMPYDAWEKSHQPFHWLAEYYDIIQGNGGFDVVIGNPPYVEYNKKVQGVAVSDIYKLNGLYTIDCGNLYAYVMERSMNVINRTGHFSMIIPMSFITTKRMTSLRRLFSQGSEDIHIISLAGDWHPGKLFEGVRSLFSIVNCKKSNEQSKHPLYTTNYLRWYNQERDFLLSAKLSFEKNNSYQVEESLPKFGKQILFSIFQKCSKKPNISNFFSPYGEYDTYYRNAGIAYYNIAINFNQKFYINGTKQISSTLKILSVDTKKENDSLVCLMNSSLFALSFFCYSDCYHLTLTDIKRFKADLRNLQNLQNLTEELMSSIDDNSIFKTTYYKTKGTVEYQEFYPRKSKSIIDKIDKVLAKHYGFTDEELDFIINYDIKYRMGDELNEE